MYTINSHTLRTDEASALLCSWIARTIEITGWETSRSFGSFHQTGHARVGTLLDVDRDSQGGFRLTLSQKTHRELVSFTILSAQSMGRYGIELTYTIKGA